MTPTQMLLLPGALALLMALFVGSSTAAPTSALQCTTEPTAGIDDPTNEAIAALEPTAERQTGFGIGRDSTIEHLVRPQQRKLEPIIILLPQTTKATLRWEGREALFIFSSALPPIDAQALKDCAAGLLQGVSVGYDSLLLSLIPSVTLTHTQSEVGLHLILQPDLTERGPNSWPQAENIDSPTATAEDGRLRLRLLQAQLLAQTGQLAAARGRFELLRQEMPESSEPLSGLAGLAMQSGRWRQALAFYQKALLLDPAMPAVASAIDTIERAAGRRLRTDSEYRQTEGGFGTGKATAFIGGISGQQPFGDGWRLGVAADVAQVDAAQVQRSGGTIGSFSGQRRKTEFFLQHDGIDGRVVVGSLFATEKTLGGGVRVEAPDDFGMTTLRAEYRRPNWDFFQSLIDYGTRDRLAIGRRQLIISDLTGRLEVGVNRYGIETDRGNAATTSLSGELRLGKLAGLRGLSTAYVFDGEYVLRRSEQTDAAGQRFVPLQILDREVHAVTLSYAGVWGDSMAKGLLTAELSGGYGVDRYGKAGPLVSGAVGYGLNQLDVRLRGSYVENIGRARGTTTVLGLALTWSF
jgi:hypothetical protein